MLTGRFLIYGEAPWKDALVLFAPEFEACRLQLLQGQFVDASKTLRKIIDAEHATNTDLLWANLLLCYARRLSACAHSGQEKAALNNAGVKHYMEACVFDPKLAYDEASDYGTIMSWLEQLLTVPQKKADRPSAKVLQEQIWQTYFVEMLYKEQKFQAALTAANQGLAVFPQNHFLLFVRSVIYLSQSVRANHDPVLLLKSEEDLSKAIEFGLHSPDAKHIVSKNYFHRAQVRYFLGNPKGTLDDFMAAMQGDDANNGAVDEVFRRAMLNKFQAAQRKDPNDTQGFNREQLKGMNQLNELIAKDNTNADLLIKKARHYEVLGQKGRAYVEYMVIDWLIRTKVSSPKTKTPKEIEEKLKLLKEEARKEELLKAQELKGEEKHKDVNDSAQKKREKRERQKQKKMVHDLVSGILNGAIAKLEDQERKVEEDKRLKLELERRQEEKRQAEENALRDAQRKAEEQKNELIRGTVSRIIQGALTTIEYQEQEKARQEAERRLELQRVKQEAQEKIQEQEVIIFAPELSITIPEKIVEFIRALKALEGRLAQRSHLYGGSVRDQALEFKRESQDYDVRVALPLSVVPGVMKKIFNLREEPKIENNLVQISLPIANQASGTESQAVIAVSHSEALANENLSYTEAAREDALTLDFVQNAFIATIPEQGLQCPVYYPLAWWDVYYSPQPATIEAQLEKARNEEGLGGSLRWMRGQAIFLVGTAPELDVYFVKRSPVAKKMPITIIKMDFSLPIQSTEGVLLFNQKHGRVKANPDSQLCLQKMLKLLNEMHGTRYNCSLDSRKMNVVSKVAQLPQLGTILNADRSFRQDPIRMLRVIHLTTALGYEGLNDFVCNGIMQNSYAFKRMIYENPGKMNAWFNKLFCKDGNACLIDNWNLMAATGLLGLAFPELGSAFNHPTINAWLGMQLAAASGAEKTDGTEKLEGAAEKPASPEKPSLNYLYCVFATCASLVQGHNVAEVIARNPLWAFNFKGFYPLRLLNLATSRWNTFYLAECAKAAQAIPAVKVNITLKIENHFHIQGQSSPSPLFSPDPGNTPSPTFPGGDGSRASPRSEEDELEPGQLRIENRKGG